ncbi:MAG TPA: alpha-hydroxy acid oxidase [Candidatus Binatia bacterium]|nr:alpha-hydroxy acid oxidase [Candidatus Binatia bacterium]
MTAVDVLAVHREADARLGSVVNLLDFEAIARDRMAPAAYGYVAGGAGDEWSLARNLAAWREHPLRPRVLVDVSDLNAATTLLGTPVSMPVGIAPTASHGLAHPDAELATARAAATAGVPFILSTMSTYSIEDVAAAAPDAIRWFQLYTQPDPTVSRQLVERAEAAGFRAIVVTVDLPILGNRERDVRNGFDLDVPRGNFAAVAGTDRTAEAGVGELPLLGAVRHTNLRWRDLAEIRSWTSLPIVLKGILTGEDARLAVDHGADAIVVSNHGARQLDGVPAPLDVLEEVVAAVGGRTELWVDGGVRRGIDIVVALALGARGVLVGRPVLYALAAGGQAGVELALALLQAEFELSLALVGARTVGDIGRAYVV